MSRTVRRRWWWLGACLVIAVGGLLFVRFIGDATPARPKVSEGGLSGFGSLAGANVLLITLDTTRADRFGCYGNEDVATPTLDRLADEGVLFSRATAVTPVTLPSHATILTGLYPRQHGVRSNGFYTLDAHHVTLAEVLLDAGYETGAVLASFVLSERYGLAQGFADYDDDLQQSNKIDPLLYAERSATQVTDRSLGWLADHTDRNFLLWVHYFDPHSPYQAPNPYQKSHPGRPYDAEIAYVDAEMGRLLAGLARLGLDDNTIVVVVGDHGESLREHDEPTHGYLLYEGTMDVPLVIRCGQRLGGGIERTDRVSQIDVMPTVLALLGLDAPTGMAGVDLQQGTGAPRVLFGETYQGKMEHGWAALFSVYDDDTKYVYGPNPELYELEGDPREQDNLYLDQLERAAGLHEQLKNHFGAELNATGAPTPSKLMSADERARLQSLGYTFSSPKGAPQSDRGADPRRMMAVMSEVDRVVFGKPPEERGPEVIAQLEGILQKNPDFVPGYRYLGILRRANGDHEGAVAAFAQAVNLHPDSPDLRLMLADGRGRIGQTEQATRDLQVLLAAHPQDAKAYLMLGRLLMASDQPDSALAPLRIATELEPDLPGGADSLELAYANAGRSIELLPVLDASLAAHPSSPAIRKAKAVLLYRQGKDEEGDEVLREGVRLAPTDPQAVNNLVKFLVAKPDPAGNRTAEAAALLAGLPENELRSDPELLLSLSQVQGVGGQIDEALKTCRQALELAQRGGRKSVARQAGQYLGLLEEARSGRP